MSSSIRSRSRSRSRSPIRSSSHSPPPPASSPVPSFPKKVYLCNCCKQEVEMCIACIERKHTFEIWSERKYHPTCGCGGIWNAITRNFDPCQNNQICAACCEFCSDSHPLMGFFNKTPSNWIDQCRYCVAQSSSDDLYDDEDEDAPDKPDLKAEPLNECEIHYETCPCCLEKKSERLRKACSKKSSCSNRFCLDCLQTCVFRIALEETCRLCLAKKSNDWSVCKKKSVN